MEILYDLANSQYTWRTGIESAIRITVESLQRFADENPEAAGIAGIIGAIFVLSRLVTHGD